MSDSDISQKDRVFLKHMRILETGDPAQGIELPGAYLRVLGNDSTIGAYGMKRPALAQIGAIKRREEWIREGRPGKNYSLNNSSIWSGKFGKSEEEFLQKPDLQDHAAQYYMHYLINKDKNNYLKYVNSKINGDSITFPGLVFLDYKDPASLRKIFRFLKNKIDSKTVNNFIIPEKIQNKLGEDLNRRLQEGQKITSDLHGDDAIDYDEKLAQDQNIQNKSQIAGNIQAHKNKKNHINHFFHKKNSNNFGLNILSNKKSLVSDSDNYLFGEEEKNKKSFEKSKNLRLNIFQSDGKSAVPTASEHLSAVPIRVVVVNGRDIANGFSEHLASNFDAPSSGMTGVDPMLSPYGAMGGLA